MHVLVRPAAAIVAAALLSSACGSQIAGSALRAPRVIAPLAGAAATTTTATSTTPAVPSDAPSTEMAAVYADLGEVKLGQTFTFDDGLAITVSGPTEFTPSSDAYFLEEPHYVGFTVTIANQSTTKYDPRQLAMGGLSGSTELTEVWDAENGFDQTPTQAVRNGDELSFEVGFGVEDPNDLNVWVYPAADYPAVYFTSTGTMSADAADVPTPTDSVVDEADSDTAVFGQTYQWDSGLDLSVSSPTAFVPSEDADYDPAPAYLGVTVTVVNNSDEVVPLESFAFNAKSGGIKSEEIFDYDNRFAGAPWAGLFPGRTAVFRIGFAVADATDLAVQVSPDYTYFGATFTA